MFPCMDTAIRPPGNRSGALTPSRTVGGLSSHMDPGYDEGDWELDIRRTQEDANTEVSQNSSSLFQQFLGATSSACHVGLSVDVWILRVQIRLLHSSGPIKVQFSP